MKKIFVTVFSWIYVLPIFAQQQTFDIITYTAPPTWEKKATEAGIQFMKDDPATGTYCVIILYKSTPATGDAKENFDMAWTSLVKDAIQFNGQPEMAQPVPLDGWEVLSGHASFERDGIKGVAMLINSSGFGKMVNAVILTNSDKYEKEMSEFIESIKLAKPAPAPAENNNAPLIGTWGVSRVTASYTNMSTSEGSILTQYTFNADGTYSFYIKTFQYLLTNLLLTRETGKYYINGNNITIDPKKSVVESWTKKDGTDKWGKLISSQKRELEKVTYQFGIEQFATGASLMLRSAKTTKRDGHFNNYEKDAWIYPSKSNLEIIKLPGADEVTTINQPIKPATSDGYTFNTTNFDNGWTSTVQADWVQVTKGAISVLVHYPNKPVDDYEPDLVAGLKKAWQILVAPRYSGVGTVDYKTVYSFESIEWAEADAVDNATNKRVHIVLFKKNYSGGGGKYLECITADKNDFVQEFGEYNPSAFDWDKLGGMANLNKFAVAASDLSGKWTSNFSGTTQYVNAQTGLDAGMDTHASNENFSFGTGGKYTWDIGVANGRVGNIKFQSAKSAGQFSMVDNWQIHFSDLEGKPKTYAISFTCVKGARILWIDGKAYGKKE